MIRQNKVRIIATAVIVALAVVGCVFVLTRPNPNRVVISAIFNDSSPLVAGNKVQLFGVQIGTIKSVSLQEGKARVDMDVDRSVLPLHADATAKIMPVSLLGERYVQLDRGSDTAPVAPEGAPIPVQRTSSAVDVDQLLNTLNDPTSASLAAAVTTLGDGVAGQGNKVAAAVGALQPTMKDTGKLADLLDQQNGVLDHLIVQAQQVSSSTAPQLGNLVDSTNKTLSTVAANRKNLDSSVGVLPSTLDSFQQTLGSLSKTADVTKTNLSSLRPLTDNLDQTSKELKGFADAAKPALKSLPDALDDANDALIQARPVVDELKPAAHDLNGIAGSAQPLAADLLRHQPGVASHLENLMTAVANWAMATSNYDGLSHYFAAVVVAQPNQLANAGAGALPSGILPPNTFNPVAPDPNNPGVPSGPGLPGVPAFPRVSPPQEQGNSTPPVNNGDGGASGLSAAQEQGMFGQLLGGGN